MAAKRKGSGVGMVWFRKGLRMHDNPALLEAAKQKNMVAVFVLDPVFAKSCAEQGMREGGEKTIRGTGVGRPGINKWRFMFQSLADLDVRLRGAGNRLIVLRGDPLKELPKAWKSFKVTHMYFEADSEPYAIDRDKKVKEMGSKNGIDVGSFVSHTLHDLTAYMDANGGQYPKTYKSFCGLFGKVGKPERPRPDPKKLPPLPKGVSKSKSEFAIPSLEEVGFDEETSDTVCKLPGGETEGLRRLHMKLKNKEWIAKFKKPQTSPTKFDPASTTQLSPYIVLGCVSVRKFYWKVQEIYNKIRSHSIPPQSLHGQLLFREYFFLSGLVVPNFDRMKGNPICKQIPWGNSKKLLQAWENGQTGYPWIDACMNQLRREGWIHHLARHAVACFLTRGDLWVHWEHGRDVFHKYLVDGDWSLNNANWLWLSASAFFSAYFRVYGPVTFGRKYDPEGKFVREYVPQLAKFPKKFIFEPWKAPIAVQKECGCIIGKDYPKPIVDHKEASSANMAKMKAAYAAGKLQKAKAKRGKAQADLTGWLGGSKKKKTRR